MPDPVAVQLWGGSQDGVSITHATPPPVLWIREPGAVSAPPPGCAVTEIDGLWFGELDHGSVAVDTWQGWLHYTRSHGYTHDGRLIYTLIHPKEPA